MAFLVVGSTAYPRGHDTVLIRVDRISIIRSIQPTERGRLASPLPFPTDLWPHPGVYTIIACIRVCERFSLALACYSILPMHSSYVEL